MKGFRKLRRFPPRGWQRRKDHERTATRRRRLARLRAGVGRGLERVGDRLERVGVHPIPPPQYPARAYVADLLTLGNGVCGFLAVLVLSIEFGTFRDVDDRYFAAAWIAMGVIMDGLDGMVARRWGSTGLGASLDTISDALTFAVAPAVLMLSIQGPSVPVMASVGAVVILGCGMVRLARNRERGRADTFDGLPAPWSGAALTIVVLLQADGGLPVLLPPLVAILLGVLNVSHIRYPRTQGPALTRVVLALLAAAVGVVAALLFRPEAARTTLLIAAVLAVILIVLTPWFAPRIARQ